MNTQTANPDPEKPFASISDLIAGHAAARPHQAAIIQGETVLDLGELDRLMNRIAASLQHAGLDPGDVIAICASTTPMYAGLFLGALRAGVVVAPLSTSMTGAQLSAMLRDAEAKFLFIDSTTKSIPDDLKDAPPCISFDAGTRHTPIDEWMVSPQNLPNRVEPGEDWPLNIIYSSGTTGAPKGIVQSHGMRWAHALRGAGYGYGPESMTLLATPLYSNTTLVTFFQTVAHGGSLYLMQKFNARRYLEIAQEFRATHTMLVPVQYQRIIADENFDEFDLSSFMAKFSTSSPFRADLKAEVLKRWPGLLVDIYGMTEGGGTCVLHANEHPDKLHTVGRPVPGHEIRLIDDDGHEVPAGHTGEVVGRSKGMMLCYHRQPGLTREVEWFDPSGTRFIRTGDVGRFDKDGFLILVDRKKDVIISGGFNIYSTDLEAELLKHPAVAEAAVIGVPSDKWGETPVAYVVPGVGSHPSEGALLEWFNSRVGSTQRLSKLVLSEALPRSDIGKVLKRLLKERFLKEHA